MRLADTSDLCWKSAVFYRADVKTFYDSNGDGTADIRGITDFLGVDPRLGTLDDLVEIDLEPYGYRWLRVKRPEDEPIV